jgi:hypothetical protein
MNNMIDEEKYTPLVYLTDDYDFELDCKAVFDISDGMGYRFYFDNGYGASVIKHEFSYGSENDLFEVAELIQGKHGYVLNDKVDIVGYLDNDEVLELLDQIKHY